VKDVLARDPARQIEPIIKVDERDPRVVGLELEEYVVTEEIRRYLEDIIDRFIESRYKVPESVCVWISGFFGSGKSHFLKFLGHLLSNKTVILEDGREVGVATHFCSIHSLPGRVILEKELKTKAIFVNMLNFPRDIPEAPSITKIIYTALLEESGLSEVPWIAEIEKMIQERGLWNDFLEYIEKETGKSWQHIRRMTVMAGPLLAKALCKIDPKTYYSLERAEKSIEEVKASFELTPRKLVEMLVGEAEKLGGGNGRIVLLLDEVGLYIGTYTDRLTDLNILAEEIERIGKGKVWLFVTAQEAIEDVIPRVEAYRGQFEKVKDRFQIKVTLTPENIDTVVKKRLLSKIPGKLKDLEALYDKYSGSLATSGLIKNPAREYGGLLTRIDKKSFIESYPLMPYHVLLMQQIFTQLRLRGRTIPELLGVRERAILSVVRALLIGPKADVKGLAYSEVGSLATFDSVYDAIHLEIRGEYQAMIEEADKLGEKEGLKVSSVAKALFLLQQVGEWIPTTVENISAILYPHLGEDGTKLKNKVKNCLEELRKNKWVVEDEGKWRFLTNIERTFEQDVAAKVASISEKRDLATEIIKGVITEFRTYNYAGIRVFDVHLFLDDKEITTKGQLNLHFYSPLAAEEKDLVKRLLAKSLANKDSIYLVSKPEKKFEELLEKIICTEKAIRDREAKPLTSEEENTLSKYRKDLDVLKNDELPRLFENACRNGTILVQGKEIKLDGRKPIDEVIKYYLKEVIDDLFTQFSLAAYKVEKDEHIGAILTWQRGRLPSIYKDLQLIDDKGDILIDRPVASRILQEVRRRHQQGEDTTGASLIEHFGSQPYGWDPKIVRLILATLFRNGSIIVNLDGKEFVSTTEVASHEAFTNSRSFNRAKFYPGVEVTPEQRNKAWELMSSIFGVRVDNTIEDIDKNLIEYLSEKIEQLNRLRGAAEAIDLPIIENLNSLGKVMEEIKDAPSRSKRILNFIEDSRVEILEENIPLLEKLVKFDEKGNLKEYKLIVQFLREIGQKLVKLEVEDEDELRKLSESIKSREFMEVWPTILSNFKSLQNKYERLYSKLHNERNKLVSNAIESLKSHLMTNKLKKEEFIEIIKPLSRIHCSSEKVELDENFVCKTCRASLEELNLSQHVIESEERSIREELNKRLRRIEPEAEQLIGFEERIKSRKDLKEVTKRLEEVSERAFKEKRAVKVNVRVE
jgi:low affinity Fe/Cu permease